MSSLISYMVIKNDLTNIKKYQLDIRLFDDVLKTNFDINTDNLTLPHLTKPLPRKKFKIFCMILTSAKNLESKAKIIYETWAHKCDNYKFISTVSDEIRNGNDTRYKISENGTEFHYHFDILQPPGLINDTYSKLTDKVYITLKHLYNKYNDYDWYLKADDDTYIFVDNLRKFVSDKNPSSPVTYGYDFKVIVQNGYHSGGGGYLLSNEAFKRLGGMLNNDYKYCPNTGKKCLAFIFFSLYFIFIFLGTEDVDIARCLRRLGVYPNKSIDDSGRERFHPLSISGHYNGKKTNI